MREKSQPFDSAPRSNADCPAPTSKVSHATNETALCGMHRSLQAARNPSIGA